MGSNLWGGPLPSLFFSPHLLHKHYNHHHYHYHHQQHHYHDKRFNHRHHFPYNRCHHYQHRFSSCPTFYINITIVIIVVIIIVIIISHHYRCHHYQHDQMGDGGVEIIPPCTKFTVTMITKMMLLIIFTMILIFN